MLRHPRLRTAKAVLAYASINSEVHTHELLAKLTAGEIKVLLPRVDRVKRELEIYLVRDLNADLSPGTWGILEPNPARCERVDAAHPSDVVIVPGVAFSAQGQRLGYGGGYYDKLLARWACSGCFMAPAFDEQVVEDVPADDHDIRVHWVITPTALHQGRSEGN